MLTLSSTQSIPSVSLRDHFYCCCCCCNVVVAAAVFVVVVVAVVVAAAATAVVVDDNVVVVFKVPSVSVMKSRSSFKELSQKLTSFLFAPAPPATGNSYVTQYRGLDCLSLPSKKISIETDWAVIKCLSPLIFQTDWAVIVGSNLYTSHKPGP